jgi:hypothetical protein
MTSLMQLACCLDHTAGPGHCPTETSGRRLILGLGRKNLVVLFFMDIIAGTL